jgi:hypothetical protein
MQEEVTDHDGRRQEVANEQFEKHLKGFRLLATDLLKAARNKRQKDEVTDMVKEAYRSLGIAAKGFDMNCPPGWRECADGSCVPEGELCIPNRKSGKKVQ